MKVEVDFDQSFDSEQLIAKSLGRLQIGNHIGRLYFTPEGKTRLVINKKAIKDGSISFMDILST